MFDQLFNPGSSLLGRIPIFTKSKVFVSYQHSRDQQAYRDFSRIFCDHYEAVEDNSLERAMDSNDPVYVMRRIREKHITGTSCTIVLCEAETPWRKYVDWEIDATLDKQHALIGVEFPTCTIASPGRVFVPNRLWDNINSRYAVWITWQALIQGGASFLQKTIEEAKGKPKGLIQNGRERMSQNKPPPWKKDPAPLPVSGQLGLGSLLGLDGSLFGPK